MTDSTHDKSQGKVHGLKGAVKEKVGQVSKNPNLEIEGTDEKVSGKVQRKVGDVKKFSRRSGLLIQLSPKFLF